MRKGLGLRQAGGGAHCAGRGGVWARCAAEGLVPGMGGAGRVHKCAQVQRRGCACAERAACAQGLAPERGRVHRGCVHKGLCPAGVGTSEKGWVNHILHVSAAAEDFMSE